MALVILWCHMCLRRAEAISLVIGTLALLFCLAACTVRMDRNEIQVEQDIAPYLTVQHVASVTGEDKKAGDRECEDGEELRILLGADKLFTLSFIGFDKERNSLNYLIVVPPDTLLCTAKTDHPHEGCDDFFSFNSDIRLWSTEKPDEISRRFYPLATLMLKSKAIEIDLFLNQNQFGLYEIRNGVHSGEIILIREFDKNLWAAVTKSFYYRGTANQPSYLTLPDYDEFYLNVSTLHDTHGFRIHLPLCDVLPTQDTTIPKTTSKREANP